MSILNGKKVSLTVDREDVTIVGSKRVMCFAGNYGDPYYIAEQKEAERRVEEGLDRLLMQAITPGEPFRNQVPSDEVKRIGNLLGDPNSVQTLSEALYVLAIVEPETFGDMEVTDQLKKEVNDYINRA